MALPQAQRASTADIGTGRPIEVFRKNRDFRHLFLASVMVSGADWIVLIPLLKVLNELTGNGMWTAAVLGTAACTNAVLLPFAGAVADRIERKRIMLTSSLAAVGVVFALLAVHSSGTAWIAVVANATLAAARAFYLPAASAAVPNLVSASQLASANALTGSGFGAITIVAACVGGLLATFPLHVSVALTTAGLLGAAALVAGIHRPFQPHRSSDPVGVTRVEVRRGGFAGICSEAGNGLHYLKRQPRLLALVSVKSAAAVGNGAQVLFPLLAVSFASGALGAGMLFAVRGLGILLGPLLLPRLMRRATRLLPALALSMAACGLSYLMAAQMPSFPLLLLFVLAANMAAGGNWAMSSCALQAEVPDELRGRVLATDVLLSAVTVAASQFLVGAFADIAHSRMLLGVCGATTLLYACGWRLATRRVAGSASQC